jgi:hypothetical protein
VDEVFWLTRFILPRPPHCCHRVGRYRWLGFAGEEGMELVIRLFQTAHDGNVAGVREAVALGADVNERGLHGATPLHVAAHIGHVELATALIALGAVTEAQSTTG